MAASAERIPRRILPVIVLAQFAGTSLWFASNAVMGDLQRQWQLPASALGTMTSAVQFGFIAGTLCFAWFAWADRFSPRLLFLVSALLGAAANLMIWLAAGGLNSLLLCRFATGFFLAGIYPVGMKIAVAWYRQGVGRAIGYLVGALVLGTAFPHLLRASRPGPPLAGGDRRKLGGCGGGRDAPVPARAGRSAPPPGRRLQPGALRAVIRSTDFRRASFAYFGHQWELYALWTFIPALLALYAQSRGLDGFPVSLWSFLIIGGGSAGCIIGGIASRHVGSLAVAFAQLAVSGLCCLLVPLAFRLPPGLFLTFLLVWGIAVVGDSPQYSALSARTAPPEQVGSALTLMNCLGFAVTIGSIQLLSHLRLHLPLTDLLPILALGPLFGLRQLWCLGRRKEAAQLGR